MLPMDILKNILGITTPPDPVADATLQSYIDRAQAQVESYISQAVPTTSYDEAYQGVYPTLYSKQWPIDKVTEIVLDGTVQALTDFWIDKETGYISKVDPTTRQLQPITASVLILKYDAGYGVNQNYPIWLAEVIANVAARISSFPGKRLDDSITNEAIAGVYSVGYKTGTDTNDAYPFIPKEVRVIIDSERGRTI